MADDPLKLDGLIVTCARCGRMIARGQARRVTDEDGVEIKICADERACERARAGR